MGDDEIIDGTIEVKFLSHDCKLKLILLVVSSSTRPLYCTKLGIFGSPGFMGIKYEKIVESILFSVEGDADTRLFILYLIFLDSADNLLLPLLPV
jgi:hypothetical protein